MSKEKRTPDQETIQLLMKMMDDTTDNLKIHLTTLKTIGRVQRQIQERLDHIENFLDSMYGAGEEEDDRIVN